MRRFILVSFCLAAIAQSAEGNPGDVFAEIMASPASIAWLSPGHAFVCITYDLSMGIKEECFGFYASNKPGEVYVGAPSLSNEFKKRPERFSQISWSIKKKITDEQRRAFMALVSRVDAGTYRLLANNCGDFVYDVVNSLGLKNVQKGILPEPYVRELLVANISGFRHSSGLFRRVGDSHWTETGASTFSFSETGHDSMWIFLRDNSRNLDIRLPIKGGFSQWRTQGPWQNLYSEEAIVE